MGGFEVPSNVNHSMILCVLSRQVKQSIELVRTTSQRINDVLKMSLISSDSGVISRCSLNAKEATVL